MKKLFQFIFITFLVGTICSATTANAAILSTKTSARSSILIDQKTGQIISAYNENKRLPIASISKLLVTYLIESKIQQHKFNHQTKIHI